MQVNADAEKGELRVAVLDRAGKPIEGLTDTECRTITNAAPSHDVTWSARKKLTSLKGQTVRLRFHLSGGARLYAFAIIK